MHMPSGKKHGCQAKWELHLPFLDLPHSPATGVEYKHTHDTALQVCSTFLGKTISPSVGPAVPQFVTFALCGAVWHA